VDQHPRPHRPAPYADLTAFIDAAGGLSPSSRAEVAAATAAVLVQAGREIEHGGQPADDDRFVALVERVGIDTLAALWRDSDPVSLPGALWALYLLRQWFHDNTCQVLRFWRAGAPLAPADAAVTGVAEPAGEPQLRDAADAIVNGVYRGDVAVALERAAAAFRVMAAGRRDLAADCTAEVLGDDEAERGRGELDRAERNERVASDLAAAAARWRAGTLN
jgi:hypothetical protein